MPPAKTTKTNKQQQTYKRKHTNTRNYTDTQKSHLVKVFESL